MALGLHRKRVIGNLLYLLSSNKTLLEDATNKDLLDSYREECIIELYKRAENPNYVKEELDKIRNGE